MENDLEETEFYKQVKLKENGLSWDKYFMGIAMKVAEKSKDPSTKVGCVIVSKDNEPISFGFNGWVKGCDETKMTWGRPLKYHMIIHAEMNAILFAKKSLEGAKLYCTHVPCDNCTKHILQAGIREIYYRDSSVVKRFSDDTMNAIGRLIESTGAKVIKVEI